MEKLIFREEQSFRQSFVIWIMLASIVLLIVGFGIAFYQQLYLGKPFGTTPGSDSELILSSIISISFMTVAFAFLLYGALVVEIWSDGIRYKFTPLIRRMKHIPLSEIATVEVGKYKPLTEFGGWGIRQRFLSRKRAYNVVGKMGLRVIKQDGSHVMFGTQLPNEMKRAIDKWSEKHKVL